MSREPSGVASSSAPAAAAAASSSAPASSFAAAEGFQSDEVPDHGVKRVRSSPHVDASEMSPGDVEHSEEHAQEHSRGLKHNQSPRRRIWMTPVIKGMQTMVTRIQLEQFARNP